MGNIAPAFVTVNPSFIEPGLLLPYAQTSGAFDLIPEGSPVNRLSEGDLFVYIKRVDVRTRMAGAQSAYNQLPSATIAFGQISTPSYLVRVRTEYDHHDTRAVGEWGVGIADAQRLATQQGHFQLARNALLYGFNPQLGEGLINTNGATTVSLPPDSNNNDTVVTYDNGEMGVFLLSQFGSLKTRTNQLGQGREFTIVGPQRVLETFEYQGIVQLTQFQRTGAGSETTKGVVEDVMSRNKDTVTWTYDDTLIGKGAGGTDAVIICMPKVVKPKVMNRINTNKFADLAPGLEACTQQYCDQAMPKEIPTPIPGGAIDIVSEWRLTSGWGIRPEAVTIISMLFQ